MLLTRAGGYEEGCRLVEEAKAVADELGLRQDWWVDWWFAGVSVRFAGDPERALRLYVEAEQRWPIMRENRLVCETPRAALLCDNGRYDEALPVILGVMGAQTAPWMRRAPLLCSVLVLRPLNGRACARSHRRLAGRGPPPRARSGGDRQPDRPADAPRGLTHRPRGRARCPWRALRVCEGCCGSTCDRCAEGDDPAGPAPASPRHRRGCAGVSREV